MTTGKQSNKSETETSVLFLRPRGGSIRLAEKYSGRSKSRLYQIAAVTPGLFKKDGAATIVDFNILDQVIDAFPPAEIKPAKVTPIDPNATSPRHHR